MEANSSRLRKWRYCGLLGSDTSFRSFWSESWLRNGRLMARSRFSEPENSPTRGAVPRILGTWPLSLCRPAAWAGDWPQNNTKADRASRTRARGVFGELFREMEEL